MLFHALPFGRRAGKGLAAAGLAAMLAAGGCTQPGPSTAAPGARLFARGLDAISELYIERVTDRQLALAAALALAQLDPKFRLAGGATTGESAAVGLDYDGREIVYLPAPAAADHQGWGNLLAELAAAARRASPRLAALPDERLETGLLEGMTMPLDRFSHYSPPAMARYQRAERDGFGGTGITLDSKDAGFRVTAVGPDSPAERAGIRPEDAIVAIDGVATAGRPTDDAIRRLRGPVGSTVAVEIQPPGGERRDLTMRRAQIVLPTVTLRRDGDIEVFRIASFNHRTARQIAERLTDVGRPRAGVVLDLRGNPGGLLDQAVDLVDLFIREGPIVSTIGRNPASDQKFTAAGDGIAADVPLAVLINGGSASAAEIVAAALQDRGRAVVIGSSSYGKGTVQSVVPLPNDGELVVSWARLITPAGRFLEHHGVVPTVCTDGLPDDAAGLAAGLQRLAGAALLRPHGGLDERGWSELRAACPPRQARPQIDLELAERLLSDPALYAAAQLGASTATATDGGRPAGPGLTEAPRALSSR